MGPYMRVRSTNSEVIAFAPRPHYFNGPLHIRSVQIDIVRNAAEGLELYRRGRLDAAWIPPDRMAAFENRTDFHLSGGLDAYYAIPPRAAASEFVRDVDGDTLAREAGPALSPLESIVPPAVPDYVASPPSRGTATGALVRGTFRIRVAQPSDRLSLALKRALISQVGSSTRSTRTVWIVHSTYLLPDPGRWMGVVWNDSPPWFRAEVNAANSLTNDPVSRMADYSTTENWILGSGRAVPLAIGNLAWLTRATVSNLQVTPLGLMPENNAWSLLSLS
jgi:hypothetical protein